MPGASPSYNVMGLWSQDQALDVVMTWPRSSSRALSNDRGFFFSKSYRRRVSDKRSPPKRSAKACASSGLAKQNTAKSLSSQRMKQVGGEADRTPAAQNITSRFTRS